MRKTAAVIGALAALTTYLGAGIPSYWGDEAASIMSATRSWQSLASELQQIDAVHGAYYAFLHLWIEVFGSSEWATRAPSAIAVGFVAAGTVILAKNWYGTNIAVISGIVVTALPRTTYMAIEARSYAIAAALAVWLTIWVQSLIQNQRTEKWRWMLYGVAVAASATVFFYLLLLPTVHAAMLFLTKPKPQRRLVVGAAIGAITALIGSLPILIFAYEERAQLSFLARRGYASAKHVLVEQWFSPQSGVAYVAIVAWALIATGLVAGISMTISGKGSKGKDYTWQGYTGFWPCVVWMAAPPAILLILDATTSPTYNPRYLSFAVPAVAMLIALGMATITDLIGKRITQRAAPITTYAALIVVFVAITAPTFIAQRGHYAKDNGSDLRQVATYVQQHAKPGDAFVTDTSTRPSREPRLAVRLYPECFTGLIDAQLRKPFYDTSRIWDQLNPVKDIAPNLQAKTVWALELQPTTQKNPADAPTATTTPENIKALQAVGYVITNQRLINRTVVYTLQRH